MSGIDEANQILVIVTEQVASLYKLCKADTFIEQNAFAAAYSGMGRGRGNSKSKPRNQQDQTNAFPENIWTYLLALAQRKTVSRIYFGSIAVLQEDHALPLLRMVGDVSKLRCRNLDHIANIGDKDTIPCAQCKAILVDSRFNMEPDVPLPKYQYDMTYYTTEYELQRERDLMDPRNDFLLVIGSEHVYPSMETFAEDTLERMKALDPDVGSLYLYTGNKNQKIPVAFAGHGQHFTDALPKK